MVTLKSAACLIIYCLLCTNLYSQQWMNFQWMGATADGREFKYAGILLPVQIPELKGNLMAQFDLGSDISQLYGNSLKNYFPDKAALFKKLDTLHKGTSDNGTNEYPVSGLQVTTSGYPINGLYLAEGFGDEVPKDSLYTASEKIIGTIGASFTKDKVLVIDFPNHRLCLLDTLDKHWSSRTTFVNCRMRKGRIQLPFTVHGKTIWIMFDTGASIFPMTLDSALWTTITDPKARQDTMHIPSWGETVPCYGAPITGDIYLGQFRMPKTDAWYMDNKRLTEFNREEDISGLTGNAYFLHSVIVIDFRNKRFGVVN